MESIHELFTKVRNHPDYRGGTIFTFNDKKNGWCSWTWACEERMVEDEWESIQAGEDLDDKDD